MQEETRGEHPRFIFIAQRWTVMIQLMQRHIGTLRVILTVKRFY